MQHGCYVTLGLSIGHRVDSIIVSCIIWCDSTVTGMDGATYCVP